MSTATKPTIIVIPGSFSPLSFYTPIITDLQAHGYAVHGIELETVGRRTGKAPGLYDDAAAVASLVSQLADEGKDVVLVPHSYGGLVACEAAKGLAKSVREKDGKQGGIARIVFVTAVVGLEGQSLKDVFGDVTLDFLGIEVSRVRCEGCSVADLIMAKGEYMVMDAAKSASINFSDLAPEEALSWATKMPNHAAVCFGQNLTYEAYKDIPVSWLLTEEDKCISPELQNKIIATMESRMEGRSVDRHPVKAGHCINVSQPKTVAAVVRKALGDEA